MSLLGSLGLGFLGTGLRRPVATEITWSPAPSASESIDGNFTVLTVTGNSTLTTSALITADFLLVAQGGGSGPHNYGGGGGAGGLVYATSKNLAGGTDFPVAVGSNVTFNGYTALNGGPTGSTGSPDPDGSRTRGRPGGSGGGAGRAGGGIGGTSQGGPASQPGQSQPAPTTYNVGNPGFGPGGAQSGGGGAGGGGPATTRSNAGGSGQAVSITGSSITYSAGGPGPSRTSEPGSSNPNTPGRGGGGSVPGSLIIRYQKGNS